jgi:transcriptional regulator with XRE-family HTH domain
MSATAYNQAMARKLTRSRPPQGAHLLQLRQNAGLTQWELADAIGENQSTVALWERSENPPRSEALPRLAKALNVRVEQLLVGADAPKHAQEKKSVPKGKLGRAFQEAAKLPRSQQDKIVDVVMALVKQYEA